MGDRDLDLSLLPRASSALLRDEGVEVDPLARMVKSIGWEELSTARPSKYCVEEAGNVCDVDGWSSVSGLNTFRSLASRRS